MKRKTIRPYADRIYFYCTESSIKNRAIDYIINQIEDLIYNHTSYSPGPIPLITGILIGLTIGVAIGWLF